MSLRRAQHANASERGSIVRVVLMMRRCFQEFELRRSAALKRNLPLFCLPLEEPYHRARSCLSSLLYFTRRTGAHMRVAASAIYFFKIPLFKPQPRTGLG